jgi:glutamyl-tRNA synthetase
LSLPTPKLNQPIRIAMTGSTHSPSLGLTLSLFGKEESHLRISNAIKYLEETAS